MTTRGRRCAAAAKPRQHPSPWQLPPPREGRPHCDDLDDRRRRRGKDSDTPIQRPATQSWMYDIVQRRTDPRENPRNGHRPRGQQRELRRDDRDPDATAGHVNTEPEPDTQTMSRASSPRAAPRPRRPCGDMAVAAPGTYDHDYEQLPRFT